MSLYTLEEINQQIQEEEELRTILMNSLKENQPLTVSANGRSIQYTSSNDKTLALEKCLKRIQKLRKTREELLGRPNRAFTLTTLGLVAKRNKKGYD